MNLNIHTEPYIFSVKVFGLTDVQLCRANLSINQQSFSLDYKAATCTLVTEPPCTRPVALPVIKFTELGPALVPAKPVERRS